MVFFHAEGWRRWNGMSRLAQALWKVRHFKHISNDEEEQEMEQRQRVLRNFNLRASSHINLFLSDHDKDVFELADTTLQELVDGIDPILWESIHTMTMSTAERRDPATVSARAHHTRFVRRFFILCSMLYCINDKYTIPLHTLLTSLIDGQGGTETLIKMLNQLGICSSMDTLKSHPTQA